MFSCTRFWEPGSGLREHSILFEAPKRRPEAGAEQENGRFCCSTVQKVRLSFLHSQNLFLLGAGPCVICLGGGGGGVLPTEVGGGFSVFHVFSKMGPWGSGSTVGGRWEACHAGGLVIWVSGMVCDGYLCRVAERVSCTPVE